MITGMETFKFHSLKGPRNKESAKCSSLFPEVAKMSSNKNLLVNGRYFNYWVKSLNSGVNRFNIEILKMSRSRKGMSREQRWKKKQVSKGSREEMFPCIFHFEYEPRAWERWEFLTENLTHKRQSSPLSFYFHRSVHVTVYQRHGHQPPTHLFVIVLESLPKQVYIGEACFMIPDNRCGNWFCDENCSKWNDVSQSWFWWFHQDFHS